MRFNEFKVMEIPDDGNRGGQEPNRPTELVAGKPYKNKQEVAKMQGDLERMGYSVGHTGIDGLYGPRTAAAVTAYKKANGLSGDGKSISTQDAANISKGKRAPADVAQQLSRFDRSTPTASRMAVATGETGEGSGRVSERQGGIRNKPISSALKSAISKAAEEVKVDVVVRSGGQMSKREAESQGARVWTNSSGQKVWRLDGVDVRIGSTRHDNGHAADIDVYSNGGQVALDTPLMNSFVASLFKHGCEGGGGGKGYMGNRIHVDVIGTAHGGGETWRSSQQFVAAVQTGKRQRGVA